MADREALGGGGEPPAEAGHPILLGRDGRLLDGGHRLAKAYLSGAVDVLAVQFEEDPEPDWVDVG